MRLQRTLVLFFMLYGLLLPAYAEENINRDFPVALLKVDASNLKTAQDNKKFWTSKQKKLQTKLNKLTKDSDPWFTVFWDLQNANIELDQWKGETQRISQLLPSASKEAKETKVAVIEKPVNKIEIEKKENTGLIEKDNDSEIVTKTKAKNKVNVKTDIKIKKEDTRPIAVAPKPSTLADKIDQPVKSDEASFDSLANDNLDINDQSTDSRVTRLEMELYSANLKTKRAETQLKKTRKVVLKLRSTLRVAAKAIRQQKQEYEQISTRLKELNPNDALLSAKKIKIESLKSKKLIEPVDVDKVAESVRQATQQPDVKPLIAATAIKTSLNKQALVSQKNQATGRQKGVQSGSQKKMNAEPSVKASLTSPDGFISTLNHTLMSFPLYTRFNALVKGNGLLVGGMAILTLFLLLLLVVIKRRKKGSFEKRATSKQKSKALEKKYPKKPMTKEDNNPDGLVLQKTG